MSTLMNALAFGTPVKSIDPAAHNAGTVNGSAIDLTGYEGVVLFHACVGAMPGTLTNKVQGSVDNSVWNDLLAGGTFPAAAANTASVLAIDVANVVTSVGRCRYARTVAVVGTNATLVGSGMVGIKKVTG